MYEHCSQGPETLVFMHERYSEGPDQTSVFMYEHCSKGPDQTSPHV